MQITRWILPLLVVLALLTGCGGPTVEPPENPSPPPQDEPDTVTAPPAAD